MTPLLKPSEVVLSGAAGLYVAGVFLLTPLPGLSWLSLLAIAGMCGGLLLTGYSGGPRGVRQGWLGYAWAFAILVLLSSLWAQDFAAATTNAGSVFTAVLGASVFFLSLRNGCSYATVAWAAALAGAIQVALAISDLRSGATARAVALAGNANALGNQLAMACFLILGWVNRPRLLTVLAIGYAIAGTVTTGSRQTIFVWLALLLLGMSRLWTVGWRRGLPILTLWVVLIGGGGLLLLGGRSPNAAASELLLVERLMRLGQGTDHSIDVRLDMAREGLTLWAASPIMGHGVNQFRSLSPYETYSHNNYIELLTGVGLVGLLLFLGQHFALLTASLSKERWRDYPHQIVVATTVLLLLWDLAEVSYYQKPFWLVIAVLWYFVTPPERRSGVSA